MHPINISGFAGSNRAINARLLNQAVGVDAVDVLPGLGDLRPLHVPLTVATVPTSPQRQTIYREGRDSVSDANYWFSWSAIVSVIRSFDSTDTTERIYFTGSGTPKWSDNVIGLSGGAPYPQGTRELGIPAPTTPLTATLTTDGIGTVGTRFYLHTFVNDIGWESTPSPVSAGLDCKPGAVVALSSLPAAPAGAYGITLRRIYRTQPGATNAAAFLFLREVAIGVTSTTDDARALGEQIATVGYLPLEPSAFGLIALWNEMAAALIDKRIVFCQPGFIYAWPVRYDNKISDRPVALAKWEQNLLVLTTGAPVLLQGQEPAGMSETPSIASAPCAGARGVVGFKHGVVWQSFEGLAYSGASKLLTEKILTPDQWRALRPATFIAGRWQRFYVASYDDGTGARKGLMFDPLAPQLGVTWLSTGFDACWYDELADALFVLEGGNVRKFDAGAAMLTAKFTSKVFRQTSLRNFEWCKVVCDAYPVTVKVFANGALKHTRSVTKSAPFKLPGGFMAEDWQVEINTAAGSVQAVHLAVDLSDFKTAV